MIGPLARYLDKLASRRLIAIHHANAARDKAAIKAKIHANARAMRAAKALPPHPALTA